MDDHQGSVVNQHGPIESGEVNLIGVLGGEVFGREARSAMRRATLIAGAPTHLSSVAVPACVRTLPLGADLQKFVASLEQFASSGENVCVLCSGDPGFFGLARLASQLISPSLLHVYPAPSSVSVAFARVGTNWDDAVVISAHGRRGGAEVAARAIARSLKVAVLCGPEAPPHLLGRLALNQGASAREILVGTSLCELGESVWSGDLEGLASGTFDPASVVVSIAARTRRTPRITQGVRSSLELAARPDRPAAPDPATPDPGPANLRWGRPENEFAHVRGMVTKAEVRAIAISKLDLPATGVMWDVGAGSGSVSIECAGLVPGLSVHAIERDPNQLEVLHANATGTRVTMHSGEAPEAFDSLDDPDRVFVGGGGIGVLDAVLARLRPGGKVVAVYAAPERALAGARRLGGMAQVSISRAVPVGSDKTLRLQAENPVFVCWGPTSSDEGPK